MSSFTVWRKDLETPNTLLTYDAHWSRHWKKRHHLQYDLKDFETLYTFLLLMTHTKVKERPLFAAWLKNLRALNTSYWYTLAPQEPPKWRNQPPKDTLLIQREGSEAIFRCKAIGRPRPKVKWIKDGVPMKTKNNKKVSPRWYVNYGKMTLMNVRSKYLVAKIWF